MLPFRRKSKAELALEKKQAMAATIMRALESHMPKKRKRKGRK